LAMNVEELDGEAARVLELVEELPGEPLGGALELLGQDGRRGVAAPEDPAGVVILDERPARSRAVAAAHGEHRQLAVERDERFEDERHAAELRPGALDVVRFAQRRLPFAVVPAAAGLE